MINGNNEIATLENKDTIVFNGEASADILLEAIQKVSWIAKVNPFLANTVPANLGFIILIIVFVFDILFIFFCISLMHTTNKIEANFFKIK